MSVARACDGPKCKHTSDGLELPADWLAVTISAGPGDEDAPLAGSYDFATVACFDAWLAEKAKAAAA